MNNNEGSFNDEELRKRAASNEELNLRCKDGIKRWQKD